jgi:hypothetical protein
MVTPMSTGRSRRIAALALSAAFLCGCEQLPSVARQHAEQSDSIPRARGADDVARFIAGLPGRAGSPFAALESTEAWKEHRRRLDEAWRGAETSLLRGLQEFQQQELNDPVLSASPVFYPFSGPDALTLTLCFPRSPVYVMVALEPAGTLPSPSQLEKKDGPKYLAEMREIITPVLSHSFFVTRQMDRQFRGQITDGLLLPVLHLLVRTHHTILGFRYIRLDQQGQIVDRAASYRAPGRIGNKGFELEFRADSDQSLHTLYYFSVNLSDERLRENKPFLMYLSNRKGTATLLKATSYMTHRPEFSIIREQILASSAAVLQDDSGIPYRYFQPDIWKTQLYGAYNRPYGSFRWLEQPDLRKAYEAGAKPLSLHVGYGYQKVTSNLLLARRTSPPNQ